MADTAPPLRLLGKRCLVTGGSRNLGRALCVAFAQAGARVAFTFEKKVEEAQQTRALVEAAGAECLSFQGSVTDSKHVSATVSEISKTWGGLDVLVNNAAITQVLPIALLDEPDWDQVMAVNVKGPYLFSRAALKPMIKARKGRIVNMGYFASERVVEAPAHFAASKAALRGFSEALAREVGRYGVTVNYLAPGLTDVGIGKRLPPHLLQDYLAHCALGRLARAEEVAALCTWLVSDESALITGSKVVIDGGV